MAYVSEKEIIKEKDGSGNLEIIKETETTKVYDFEKEPDYIKIYTNIWCEFNDIPISYRELFLQLALRMTYADRENPELSQVVYTIGPAKTDLLRVMGWKENMLYKGLKVLQECNAIKKVSRGAYQINPSYAGKGEWKYNAKKKQGGIQNILATFDIKNKSVSTEIVYAESEEVSVETDAKPIKIRFDNVQTETVIADTAETEEIKNNELPF